MLGRSTAAKIERFSANRMNAKMLLEGVNIGMTAKPINWRKVFKEEKVKARRFVQTKDQSEVIW